MAKCPFCGFGNEDGALFCEQCKSDISGVEATPAEAVPVAQVEEVADLPIMAAAVEEEAPAVAIIPVDEPTAVEVVEVEDVVEVLDVAPPTEPAPAPPPAPE